VNGLAIFKEREAQKTL